MLILEPEAERTLHYNPARKWYKYISDHEVNTSPNHNSYQPLAKAVADGHETLTFLELRESKYWYIILTLNYPRTHLGGVGLKYPGSLNLGPR